MKTKENYQNEPQAAIAKVTDNLCVDTIRTLAMDAVQAANSGHPGTPMAMAPVTFALYDRLMKFDPKAPNWPNRDRFILSAGHASMLLYATLHITGFEVSLDDIKTFRQLHSACAGHPEYGHTPGVETTTGPLGQGLATSVGMAISQKWLAARYNKQDYPLFDYQIYALSGDGCMMEGISGEAASLAGHLGLDNLVWIYDNNRITIEGSTDLAFSEDVATRFMAYGWQVQRVGDANDLQRLEHALERAKKEKQGPSLIIVDSHIAYGSPNKQDTHGAHGAPLGEEEIRATKAFYGWDPDLKFHIPDEVALYREEIVSRGKEQHHGWRTLLESYEKDYPEMAIEIRQLNSRELPTDWKAELPIFETGTKVSGRLASSKVLNAIANQIPLFIGGSADLSPSTLTHLHNEISFQKDQYTGRNLHYGIREHAMGAIANGIALSGLRTFASTFLVFSDYARSSIRLSALMRLPVTYIFTHDSIGVGEDGPTHQPIEHIASLRAIPNLEVIRPCDANEVLAAWEYIMGVNDAPTALVLSRQHLPVLDRDKYASAKGALKGGYTLVDCEGLPELILIATGSEVALALEAYEQLTEEGVAVRMVSMPNWSLYERQSEAYQESVLPHEVKARIAVEAGATFGWRRFVGLRGEGEVLGMRSFGASGTLNSLLQEFGLTKEAIVETAHKLLDS